MGRLARPISRSGIYHILFCGVNNENLFKEKADFAKLKETIATLKQEMGFEIYAYCFMSNHVHLVLKEKNIGDISLIMKRILSKYARWFNMKYNRSGALASKFKSAPVEINEYFLPLIKYIHHKPLKASIVDKPDKYPYSSYREYVYKAELVDTTFLMDKISLQDFIEHHQMIENIQFFVSDKTKKSDEDIIFLMKKQYKIEYPKSISRLPIAERDAILHELKKDIPVNQLQKITGISKGIITRA